MTSTDLSRFFKIRRAGLSDYLAIREVETISHGLPIWKEKTWFEILGLDSPPYRHCLIGTFQNQLVAFVVFTLFCTTAELENIAVAAAYRRRGIGTLLIRAAMNEAASGGAKRFELEVRVSNVAARALYKSLGFQEQGIRLNYYREPSEHATLMAAELND
jgi:ribosomal-protein-alanine N-acetyltransferase